MALGGTCGIGLAGRGDPHMIYLKSRAEIETMRRVNVIVAEVLETLKETVRPGMTTLELDELAERLTYEKGAKPAFKGYVVAGRTFKHSLCTSINEEIVHGIPSERVLAEGDILGMDFGVVYEGFYGDSAVTLGIGEIPARSQALVEAAEGSLYAAIERAWPGARMGDLSEAAQAYAESRGFSVVRDFVGHGIGAALHEDPQIANYGAAGVGPRLHEGMVLAIEPMVNLGRPEVEVLSDGWTAVTADRRPSAHFEHSVAITASGPWVLSAREIAASAAVRAAGGGS